MKKRSKRRPFVIVLLLVVLAAIAIGAYFLFSYFNGRGNTLNNKKVFESAQKSFNEFPGVSKLLPVEREQLKKEIEPQYLAGYVTGFGPNENDIKSAKATIGDQASYETIKAYIQSVINGKMELAKTTGFYQGYVYNYWYGRTIANKYPNEEVKDWGNATVLESDKKYAKDKADEDRKKLKENKITPKALTVELNANSRLSLLDQANGSSYFQTATTPANDVLAKLGYKEPNPGQSESFDKLLASVKSSGVTEIANIVADPGYPRSGQKREVGYVMAYIEVFLKGQKSINYYDNQLKIARSKLK